LIDDDLESSISQPGQASAIAEERSRDGQKLVAADDNER
jgi:hypothetical protein